ncbi:MAG: bifunctional folylpolyglutamate synthase/dihydrofolate synthase [Deltaproteobacteria bacterium]|nr:bifunctional folylpolyglutamate synthase/dihydrofolate synthase [Deltaproteobacteria bacterium]
MRSHPILDQLGELGVRLGLDRIKAFLQVLGEPQFACPVVHVAGTNGKGSVSAYVTEALVAAGYRVGTTVSPHLEAINERVMINGLPVDDPTLTEAIEAIDRARWDWARSFGMESAPLTYFEFITCVAFHVFATQQVDVAVVEVGLGGRLDATNVVRPVVTAITQIGLDHTEVLGDTYEAIAVEKAGILKAGVPLILGTMPGEARAAIERRATAMGCPTWYPGRHLLREQRKEGWILTTPEGRLEQVTLAMPGAHQGSNALVALGVLHALRRQGFHLSDDAIRAGLSRARMPGRVEVLREGLIADGSHNLDGTRALAAWLATRPRPGRRILLWGMGEGRDAAEIIAPLLPLVDEVVTTRCRHPKARDPMELAHALQELDIVLAAGDAIETTLPEVFVEADETVVAGSLFVAGAARAIYYSGGLDGLEPGSVVPEEDG